MLIFSFLFLLNATNVSFRQLTVHDDYDELHAKQLISPEAEALYQNIVFTEDYTKELKNERADHKVAVREHDRMLQEERAQVQEAMDNARWLFEYEERKLVTIPGFIYLYADFLSTKLELHKRNLAYLDEQRALAENEIWSIDKQLAIQDAAWMRLISVFNDYYGKCLDNGKIVKLDRNVDELGFELEKEIQVTGPDRFRAWEKAVRVHVAIPPLSIQVISRPAERLLRSRALRNAQILHVVFESDAEAKRNSAYLRPYHGFGKSKRVGGLLRISDQAQHKELAENKLKSVIARQVRLQLEVVRDFYYDAMVVDLSGMSKSLQQEYIDVFRYYSRIYGFLPLKHTFIAI